MQQVSRSVFVETNFYGCNPAFVVTSGGVVMIDGPFMPSDALAWRKEIEARGDVAYFIQMEHHRDHMACNGFFGGVVISHPGTREAFPYVVARARQGVAQDEPEHLSLWDANPPRYPAVTLTDKATLYVGDHTFEIMSLPGHTANELAVVVPEERVVFVSDTVSNRRQVYFIEAFPFQWLESLKKIESLDVDAIVTGHGEVCDRAYLKEFSAFIEEWIETVMAAVQRGLSKEEIVDSISFLDRYPMEKGRTGLGPQLQRLNCARLYDLLTSGEDSLPKLVKL